MVHKDGTATLFNFSPEEGLRGATPWREFQAVVL
jgi:hypothetical protein